MTNKVVNFISLLVISVCKVLKRRVENVPLMNSLKVQRAKLGINQAELGKLANVSRQTISSIERGEYNPSVTLALKIAKIFNVSVEDIFIYEEDNNDE